MSVIKISDGGTVKALYDESLTDFLTMSLGVNPKINRWSNIEYSNERNCWQVTMAETGKVVHEAPTREACVTWEKNKYNKGE